MHTAGINRVETKREFTANHYSCPPIILVSPINHGHCACMFWGARLGEKIPLVKKHRVALIQNSNDAPRTELRPNQVVIAEEKATSHCITVYLGAFNARGMKRHALPTTTVALLFRPSPRAKDGRAGSRTSGRLPTCRIARSSLQLALNKGSRRAKLSADHC